MTRGVDPVATFGGGEGQRAAWDHSARGFCIMMCSRLGLCNLISPSPTLRGMAVAPPYPPLDNIRVMMIVWRLRGNIIRTALCWVVWHSVHSQQHTHVISSYRSSRLGLSHWDPYAMHRGSCLELYYCNMVEWSWWDSHPEDQLVSFSALTLLVWSYDL